MHFDHQTPILPVADLKEAVAFYKEKLGFSDEWFAGDEDAGISRGNIRIIFNYNPEFAQRINSKNPAFEIMWFVAGVDEVYEEYRAKNVAIWKHIRTEPWGIREFGFEDNNGYSIRVAQGIGVTEEK